MPLLDCLTAASEIVDKKTIDTLVKKRDALIGNGISESDADQQVKNDFVNEYGKKLHDELNGIRKSAYMPQVQDKEFSKRGDQEKINQQHEQNIQSLKDKYAPRSVNPTTETEGKKETEVINEKPVEGSEVVNEGLNNTKIVDENGRPQIVYHATNAKFYEFKEGYSSEWANKHGIKRNGFYFTNNKEYANSIASQFTNGDGKLIEVHLNIKKPKIINPSFEKGVSDLQRARQYDEEVANLSKEKIEQLKSQGYDGIVYDKGREIVAFDANQIKKIPKQQPQENIQPNIIPSIIGSDKDLKGNKKEEWMHLMSNEIWDDWNRVSDRNMFIDKWYEENQSRFDELNSKKDLTKSEQNEFDKLKSDDKKYQKERNEGAKKYSKYKKWQDTISQELGYFRTSDGGFWKAIKDGRMTANDAKKIIESAGLEVPNDIKELAAKENTQNIENQTLNENKGGENAINKGEKPEGNIPEHQNGEGGGKTASPSGSNSTIGSGEVQQKEKEVTPPPPTEPPTSETFSQNPSKQERVRGAYQHLLNSNISEDVKQKFKDNGIKYKVADSGEAQKTAKGVIQSFGTDEALRLARLGDFHPSVNSAVFSEAINEFYEAENNATTPEDKFHYANRWADTYNEYAELLTASGQFGSYAYNFYKTSPLGFILTASKRMDERRAYFLSKDEAGIREAYEAFKDLPEFKELFQKEVEEAAKKSRNEIKEVQKQKIKDAFDNLKIDKSKTYALPIPPQIINGAIEAMKQATLLGYEVADILKEGIDYINKNFKDAWDSEKFSKEYSPIIDNILSENKVKRPSVDAQQKILNKWDKKLSKLDDAKRKVLLTSSINEIVKNGGLDYDKFKDMYADALGLPKLTPEMELQLRDLGGKLNAVDKAKEALESDNSQENIDKFLEAMTQGELASRKINDLLGEKGFTLDRFLSIARLNTLGIANLLVNPMFNIFYQPIRFLNSLTETGLDYGLKYSGLSKNSGLSENVFYKQRAYFKGFSKGLIKSIKDLKTGDAQFDYFQKSTRQNIQPIGSAKEILAHYKGEKRLTNSELTNAIAEAFPLWGGSAAVIARGLQVGDLPFRFASEQAEAESIALQKGLTGVKKQAFLINPDDASKEIIKAAGERAVMAQNNALTNFLSGISSYIKNATSENKAGKLGYAVTKVISATTQPFIKIPVNSALAAFKLAVPEYSFMEGIYHAARGNRKEALRSFSHMITGYAIGYAISQMAAAGLVGGSGDDPKKWNTTSYIGDITGFNSFNFSGLKRLVRGDNPAYRDGDVTMNLNFLGIVGAIMQTYGDRYDKLTPEQAAKETYIAGLWDRVHGSLINGMKSNVFGNTSTLLNALDGGSAYYMNKWLRGSMNVGENFFEPAWLATAGKISDGYKPDYTAMGTIDQITSSIKERFFSGGNLPSQITVWGEKRTDAPKGINKYGYYYLDITKHQNVDAKDFGFNIAALYWKTKDDSVIPSRPQKTIRKDNQSYQLNPLEYQQFQVMVGRNRKQLAQAVMSQPSFDTQTDEIKINILKNAYEQGFQLGKSEFLLANPKVLQPK